MRLRAEFDLSERLSGTSEVLTTGGASSGMSLGSLLSIESLALSGADILFEVTLDATSLLFST